MSQYFTLIFFCRFWLEVQSLRDMLASRKEEQKARAFRIYLHYVQDINISSGVKAALDAIFADKATVVISPLKLTIYEHKRKQLSLLLLF